MKFTLILLVLAVCFVVTIGRHKTSQIRTLRRRIRRLQRQNKLLRAQLKECESNSEQYIVCSGIASVPDGFNSVQYTKSEEILENPGRGFFRMLEAKASSFNPLTAGGLDSLRTSDGLSNVLRIYILDSFVDSSISEDFLEKIRNDMRVIRDAGFTAALRFHYTNVAKDQAPYGDATKAIMLQHIAQLNPIFHEFEGFISVIQAGFIGIWGEWYYTTYFGDPTDGPLTDANWDDRKEIVKALINNSPLSIPIQLRTPRYKMHICNTTTPATLSDAHQNTCVGRAGHHNDCFLASDDDVGTYDDIAVEKPYLAQDTRYLAMSGETCAQSVDANNQRTNRSDCPTALKELAEFHWSLLHDDYHPDVINDWKSQGCFQEIHKRLGYRLSLKKVILPTVVQSGSDLCYQIVLENTGFAAPYKDWKIALVLKSQSGSQYFAANLPDVDVRSWLPGCDQTLTGTLNIDSVVPTGTYDIYLVIYDELTKQYANYYILLANDDVPEYTTGLNSLKTTLQVSGTASKSSKCPKMASWTPPTPKSSANPPTTCEEINVPDASFENQDGTAWSQYKEGFTYVTSDAQDGSVSISITNGGALHVFEFDPPIKHFVMTGYSKMVGSATGSAEDYSIYCDIQKPDTTNVWGKNAPFQQGNSQWNKATLDVQISEGIKTARCYLMFRNFASGTAYFDNVKMWNVPDSVNANTCNFN